MARYLYSELASAIQARANCQAKLDLPCATGQPVLSDEEHWLGWKARHTQTIKRLVKEYMPSGSGFDNGTSIDLDASHAAKLVFHTAFHYMDDNGYYDGWTEHTVTVTPAFDGVNIRISGRNRNGIKEYIHESFDHALQTDLTDAIAFERLADKLGDRALLYQSHWIDSCTQRWDVLRHDLTQDNPQACLVVVASGFKTWEDARHFAVEGMQRMDAGEIVSDFQTADQGNEVRG